MTKSEIVELVEKVHGLKKDRENTLPEQSYFLEDDAILCYPRSYGDSRYPYYNDGLVLFVHTDGDIDCVDGTFNVFKCNEYGEDVNTAFFAGEKDGDAFIPVSVTGANCQLCEKNVERYTVFTPVCAYYITETPDAIYAVRAYVDGQKHLRFSLAAVNRGEKRDIYLCAYFAPTLTCGVDSITLKRFGERYENGGYVLKNRNNGVFNCLSARLAVTGAVTRRYFTTAKKAVPGKAGRNLTNAVSLKNGSFDRQIPKTNTTDMPVIADLVHFSLEEDSFAQLDYEMLLTADPDEAERFVGTPIDGERENETLSERRKKENEIFERARIQFDTWHDERLHSRIVNRFLKCVQKQVSLCAFGKNYAGPYLGIRDVFQQLESALIWQPEEARAQILRVMDCILSDGRAPRQVSFPSEENPAPVFDLRPFIDQGFWIVSALHTYLAYTGDLSVLDEICGYYRAESTYAFGGTTPRSELRDSVLEHLIRITDFLVSHLDEKTRCVHALYGDWNDALNGLGKTARPDADFGNGVSVMATLQLYLALEQMHEILVKTGKHSELAEKYLSLRAEIVRGVEKNALVRGKDGTVRAVHGWGEDMSYFVGSFRDYDGASRISLTANAFCAISGMIGEFPEYGEDIAKNILSLDSKYGLLTFDKPFLGGFEQVGRICYLTPGTYENSCAYVHAGTFGIMALFLMGYSRDAWRLLEKAMVISHEHPTRTTFVMPNSYCDSEEYGADGDSTGDWYTGSGTVLIKAIVKCGFGIEPSLSALKISPADYFPCKKASVSLTVKGCRLTVKYEDRGEGVRRIYFGDEELPLICDGIRKNYYAVIDDGKLLPRTEIRITD